MSERNKWINREQFSVCVCERETDRQTDRQTDIEIYIICKADEL